MWHAGRDRDDLDPPGGQLALLRAVAELGKPLIVVLVNCRPMTFGAADGNALLRNVTALLAAWRPGTEGARAVVDLLFGQVEPSGRLAQNWIRSVGQVRLSATTVHHAADRYLFTARLDRARHLGSRSVVQTARLKVRAMGPRVVTMLATLIRQTGHLLSLPSACACSSIFLCIW